MTLRQTETETETQPATPAKGFQTGWTRFSGRHWSSDATSHFPGFGRELESHTGLLSPELHGEGEAPGEPDHGDLERNPPYTHTENLFLALTCPGPMALRS